MKFDHVNVFCPVDKEELVAQVLGSQGFAYCINPSEPAVQRGEVLCHFDHGNLSAEQHAFLICAIEFGAWVEPLVSYIDRKCGYTEIALLSPSYFFHQKAFSILSDPRNELLKRVLDWVMVFLIGIVALPVSILTIAAIKFESKGPVFYRQKRTGLYNVEFDVIKFRSMRIDAEKDGAQWALANDNRITAVGKFIRKTRIDELPQLINIARGEMSIVGPRPEREVFIQDLEKDIPYYRFRHAVKPGVTGLAQVKYAYGASLDDAIWKHKYDMFYIKHHNIWLDIKIIIRTVKTVFFGMGR